MAKKKPLILEGEIARSLGRADKLKIPLQNGSMSVWVPEDTVTTKTKSITKNGTYLPKNDDCYGYSKVTVNVPNNKMIGEGPDGNDYMVEEELDEDGNPTGDHIVTKLPSFIQIVRPPAHRNYEAGQMISFEGLAVVMLTKNRGLFTDAEHPNGVLSLDELEFPITVANGSGSSDRQTSYNGITVASAAGNSVTIQGQNRQTQKPMTETYTAGEGDGPFYTFGLRQSINTTWYTGGYVCSPKPFSNSTAYHTKTVDGKNLTAYVLGRLSYQDLFGPVTVTAPINTLQDDWRQIAWIVCYGDVTSGGGTDIPVNWNTGKYNRPNAPFTDSFKINVTGSSGSSGSDSSSGWTDMGNGESGSGGGTF